MQICDGPEQAAKYWEAHITSHPHFDPDRECLVVLLLNTRHKIKGHHLVSIGTLDTILVSASSVFRLAILAAASAIVIMHNHPSGELRVMRVDGADDSPRNDTDIASHEVPLSLIGVGVRG